MRVTLCFRDELGKGSEAPSKSDLREEVSSREGREGREREKKGTYEQCQPLSTRIRSVTFPCLQPR